ncbi:hypothetical protein BGX34_000033 [Mortierella sp. NVP85]|nr:hypothetical protein BGX34_000033 [Mortierella sp. NVP85]
MTMKSNGKDKTTPVSVVEQHEPKPDGQEKRQGAVKSDTLLLSSIHDKETDMEQASNINGKHGSILAPESVPSAVNVAAEGVDQDTEMKEASLARAEATEHDPTMTEAARRSTNGSGVSEAINQEDLDGGLLDGALDDYDDLDQDTEDTEVGNIDDFSDDDDDDLDDLDDRILDSSDKLGPDDEIHSPGELSHVDTKSDDQDSEQEDTGDQHRKGSVHSDGSDSDLPEPDGSDNENDEDEEDDEDDDNGDEEEEDDEDAEDGDMDVDEDEKPNKKISEVRKGTIMSQKPTLNRPSTTTEEELKDSGDDLSDLSEFDDTDDSDEGEEIPSTKAMGKESTTNLSAATAIGNGRAQIGGRKRSLQDAGKDSTKQDQESGRIEQKGQTETANGKARLSEKKISETRDVHLSDKESESEEPHEEEEEHEKPAEEEEEEEEDSETKQLHKDALEALTSIEVEFASLRDKMYDERMTELDREVEMINAGTHPELSSLMQEIEQKREQRLRFADMGKKYMIDMAQTTYQVAEYRAHCTFQSARRNMRTDLAQALGKKQQLLLMELRLFSDTHKRKVIDDKATLVRLRKFRRNEANELRNMSERHGFPASGKPAPATNAEVDSDLAAMGNTTHTDRGY